MVKQMKKCMVLLMSVCLCLMSGCEKNSNGGNPKAITKQVDLNKLKDGPQFAKIETSGTPRSIKLSDRDEMDSLMKENGEADLRGYDVSELPLKLSDLKQASFDNSTIWPSSLSDDVEKIRELGKNPGLGIRELHKQGITGKHVNVAIIDQNLLLDHKEYKDKIQLYEILHMYDGPVAMHGPAVTSILAGNEIGVAPDVTIYYISSFFADYDAKTSTHTDNLSYMADSIRRVIEINRHLDEGDKIRAVSISRGFTKLENPDVYDAIEEAKEEGIFVITCSTSENYDVSLLGASRDAYADPDDANSYRVAQWENGIYEDNMLYVPMDHRTTAGPYSDDDYAHYCNGGLSWTAPWLMGMYALCLEVNPELTGEEFIEIAKDTGDINSYKKGSKTYYIDEIINPQKMIDYLKAEKGSE